MVIALIRENTPIDFGVSRSKVKVTVTPITPVPIDPEP